MLSGAAARLTSVEIDEELAAMLTERFADVPSVEIVRGDATELTYPDGRVHRRGLLHDAAPRAHRRAAGPAVRARWPGCCSPARPLVASDSLASDELAAHHEGDTYNPVDPDALPDRLGAAGFADVEVRTNPFGWAAVARTAR